MTRLLIQHYQGNDTIKNTVWLNYCSSYSDLDIKASDGVDIIINQIKKINYRKQDLLENYNARIVYNYEGLTTYLEFDTAEDMMIFLLEWS